MKRGISQQIRRMRGGPEKWQTKTNAFPRKTKGKVARGTERKGFRGSKKILGLRVSTLEKCERKWRGQRGGEILWGGTIGRKGGRGCVELKFYGKEGRGYVVAPFLLIVFWVGENRKTASEYGSFSPHSINWIRSKEGLLKGGDQRGNSYLC